MLNEHSIRFSTESESKESFSKLLGFDCYESFYFYLAKLHGTYSEIKAIIRSDKLKQSLEIDCTRYFKHLFDKGTLFNVIEYHCIKYSPYKEDLAIFEHLKTDIPELKEVVPNELNMLTVHNIVSCEFCMGDVAIWMSNLISHNEVVSSIQTDCRVNAKLEWDMYSPALTFDCTNCFEDLLSKNKLTSVLSEYFGGSKGKDILHELIIKKSIEDNSNLELKFCYLSAQDEAKNGDLPASLSLDEKTLFLWIAGKVEGKQF